MKINIILALILLSGCTDSKSIEVLKQEVLAADAAMNDKASAEGFHKSILFYADDHIVKLNEGSDPIIGKKQFSASFDPEKDIKTIAWKPVDATVAKSGDLAYTWGNWQFAAKDTTLYGNYFTAWKKDHNGTWKVLLDGGNNTPKPIN